MTGRLMMCALALFASGCFSTDPGGGSFECLQDNQCNGQVCTRTGECVAESNIIDATVSWTINGVSVSPASDAPCSQIDDLSVTFIDNGGRSNDVEYAPVPCNLGRISYDKMPGRFDSVRLTAWSTSGYSLDEAQGSLQLGPNTINLDLRP